MAWTIYCHTHVDSGRRYVGLTARTWQRRWSQHVTQSRNAKNGRQHFLNAIRKYGKDAFSHEVLGVCDTLEAANSAEKEWIEFFDSRNPGKGFNLAKGGAHTPHPVSNPWDRPGFREKRGLISRELWKDPSFGQRIQATRNVTLSTKASREKRSSVSRRIWENPSLREKISSSIADKWKDEEYASRVRINSLLAKRAKLDSMRTDRAALLKTDFLNCSVHGTVSLDGCYVMKPRKGSVIPRLVCKACDRRRHSRDI